MVVAGAVAGLLGSTVQSAYATTATITDNPWVYQMTNPGQVGLEIDGSNGANTQAFIIKDYLGNPIFACNLAGGCSVLGDNFSTFGGGDVFNPTNVLLQNGGIQIGKGGPTIFGSVADPTGTCTTGTWTLTKTSGHLFFCTTGGTWVKRA